MIIVAMLVIIAVAACTSQTPEQRVTKAEAEMNTCKQRLGLADVATPDTIVLDEPGAHGQPPTPEAMSQLRLKVQCRSELAALIAARKDAGR